MTDAIVVSLPEGAGSANKLAQALGAPLSILEVHRFPDGELRVTAPQAASVAIVYAALGQPNDKLIALMFASEALRRLGAQRLVLAAPYMCYMRQDAAFHTGEAISQKVVGRLLAEAFDCIVTVDAHLHRVKDIRDVFSGIEAHDISAVKAIAEELAPLSGDARTIVAGPDVESQVWVRDLASRLNLPYAIAAKTRRGDKSVNVLFPDAGQIAGRNVILLDDMVSSGGTILSAAAALKALGATSIDVVITHALFDAVTAQAFAAAGIRTIRSADGVPHPSNAFGLAGILAETLRKEVPL